MTDDDATVAEAVRMLAEDPWLADLDDEAVVARAVVYFIERLSAEVERLAAEVVRLTAVVERLTPKPMTLEEACDVLNSSQYSYCFTWEAQGPWSVDGSYVRAGLVDDCDECMVKLDLFEATALARAFLLKGAGPIVTREERSEGDAKP